MRSGVEVHFANGSVRHPVADLPIGHDPDRRQVGVALALENEVESVFQRHGRRTARVHTSRARAVPLNAAYDPRHWMSLSPGARLGWYEILGPIGAGGMGTVYRAHDSRLQRTVALELLNVDSRSDWQAARRLLEEARAAAALNHPHISARCTK